MQRGWAVDGQQQMLGIGKEKKSKKITTCTRSYFH
jgi:hypothetical protein